MPKVTIDGVTVEVEPGTTILNAARQIGGDLVPPAMCYYSKGVGLEVVTYLEEIKERLAKDVDLVSLRWISPLIEKYVHQDKQLIYERQAA